MSGGRLGGGESDGGEGVGKKTKLGGGVAP